MTNKTKVYTRNAIDAYKERKKAAHYGFDLYAEKRADFSWTLQRIQAQTAKRDGFLGAISEDEQGEVVMIPMFEKEHLLTYKGEW